MGNAVDSTIASSQPGSEQPAGGEPPVLSVRLLGGFTVSVGDRVIAGEEWRLRKAATLVKLLSLAGGYRLHREQAMDALWPELDPAAALNNLHQALHVTRRILEPGATRHSSMLRPQGEMIVLEPPERIRTDVADFENALAAARHSGHLPAYHSAVALYGGDLLPDDRYEEWVDARRTALKNQYLETLLDIGRLSEEGGDPGSAIKALQRAVDCDPALEEAHAALMRDGCWIDRALLSSSWQRIWRTCLPPVSGRSPRSRREASRIVRLPARSISRRARSTRT